MSRAAPAVRSSTKPLPRALAAALGVVVLCAALGCAPAPAPGTAGPSAAGTSYVQHVQADQVDTWRGVHYDGLVLDVRDPVEMVDELDRLTDAVLIPVGELESRIGEIERFRNGAVLIYCATGTRVPRAGQILVTNGFRDVTILDGGLKAYRDWQGKAP